MKSADEWAIEFERAYRADVLHRKTLIQHVREIIQAAQAEARDAAATKARNPGFIEAQDTDWDAGVNFAKRYIEAAIREGI